MAYSRVEKLSGKYTILSPMIKDDVETFFEWVNDLQTTKYIMVSTGVPTIDDEYDWFEKSRKDPSKIIFSILDKKSGKLVGNCSLMKIDHVDRKAELGILLGDKDYRKEEYGSEAAALLLDYGFNTMNLHSIYLKMFDYMKENIASFKKLGFREVGVLREARFFDGCYCNTIIMDLLNKEFDRSLLKKKV